MMGMILIVCMLNGLASPWLPMIWGASPLWMGGMLPDNVATITYVSSLVLSTLTLMFSGVPAALFERFGPTKGEETPASMWIWLIAALLISLPSVPNIPKIIAL